MPKSAREVALMLPRRSELITNPHGMTFQNVLTVGTNRVTQYAVCCVVCCQQLHKVLYFVSDMELRFNFKYGIMERTVY